MPDDAVAASVNGAALASISAGWANVIVCIVRMVNDRDTVGATA
jgi:hypothetical protein